jgi:aminoglycoside phosphotransferase family enzyme/predicted kinase
MATMTSRSGRSSHVAQQAVVDFLSAPATHGGAAVERIETHSAIVFLAGARALKLKRAVAFDYLDFSTPERRRRACEDEVRLNRRTAPGIYRGVVAVTGEPGGGLALDGGGEPVDWCVDMHRFDQEAVLDRVAARGALTLAIVERLAGAIVRFHGAAAPRFDQGGAANLRWVIAGNAEGFADRGRGILAPEVCAAVTTHAFAALDRHAGLLDRRRDAGFVRQCHGDLHLRNLVLLDDEPTPFDAVEFNDAISCVDVLYDLAFLVMDLWRRGLRPHANVLLTDYLALTGDLEGVAALPLFLSCRAAVRAKTSATSATLQPAGPARRDLEALARRYLAMAATLLDPAPPRLIAIGGRSGTGKSTLARGLAPDLGAAPGAIVLRSDVIRKALFGASGTQRLDRAAYDAATSARVYQGLAERALILLRAGRTVIADAAFLDPARREAIARVAAEAGVPFAGVWLEAPMDTLIGRVAARAGDASDADAAVVAGQTRLDEGALDWERLDASGPADGVLERAARLLGPA